MSHSVTPTRAALRCPHCGGDCAPQSITLPLRRSQYGFALMRNVPADVCQNCGEAQFSLLTSRHLMAALSANRTPDEVAVIPIYDFSAVNS